MAKKTASDTPKTLPAGVVGRNAGTPGEKKAQFGFQVSPEVRERMKAVSDNPDLQINWSETLRNRVLEVLEELEA